MQYQKQFVKEIIVNLDFITIKYYVNRMRIKATEWEKIFAEDMYNKKMLSKIYKKPFKTQQ